jgi:hypothetical protein
MEDWVVTVLLEVLTVLSDFGAALAGAANPATAKTPVSKNVAAIFFIRWSFQSIGLTLHYVRHYTAKTSTLKPSNTKRIVAFGLPGGPVGWIIGKCGLPGI